MPVQFDEQNYGQAQYGGFDEPTGIPGKLINWGIAKDKRSANMILSISVVIFILIAIFVFFANRTPSLGDENVDPNFFEPI